MLKRILISGSMILGTSCTSFQAQEGFFTHSTKKQRQKMIVLQKKLEQAERQKQRVGETVEVLRSQIRDTELALIRKSVEKNIKTVAESQKLPSDLFVAERETLYKIIQEGVYPSSFEAQVVLDQILEMITNMKE
jgi:hypothetical protein